ncbi:MAG: hypothetical protein QNJ46_22495 [Leptolyngbyaceae cyanobacterium MO_188.B28]|nr:hypothetical protein [Leptolyngbyaceae cyanobacterium MO_188.B28]
MPQHPQYPHRSPSQNESMLSLYNYVPLEIWAGSQAEWSTLMRQEAVGDHELETPLAQPGRKFTLITFIFALIVLGVSAMTLIWNAGRLTEAVVQVGENTVQEVASPNRWSF